MERCCIPNCGRPPQAREGRGLSKLHCRYHVQWRNRHGSFWKGTYRAAELQPYRTAAARYLKDHQADTWIAHALQALDALMVSAGPAERVADVLRMAPAAKARAALARLRARAVPPLRLLTTYLAVQAAIAEDPVRPGGNPAEYRRIQAAKAIHRLASGYHVKYANTGYSIDIYPRSSGLALRRLGAMLEECCAWAADHHLAAIVALKVSKEGPRAAASGFEFPKSRRLTPQGAPRG